MTPRCGFTVALLGAESTGKTTLAEAIGKAFAARGIATAVVGEYLREFCAARSRTPSQDEQAAIATEQARRIDAAAAGVELVVADTTGLQIAVYSDLVFGDRALYEAAIAAQRRCDLTLVTAIDLPWRADGLQRDGPHIREPVLRKLVAALADHGIAYTIVAGVGAARLDAAIAAIDRARTPARS